MNITIDWNILAIEKETSQNEGVMIKVKTMKNVFFDEESLTMTFTVNWWYQDEAGLVNFYEEMNSTKNFIMTVEDWINFIQNSVLTVSETSDFGLTPTEWKDKIEEYVNTMKTLYNV